MNWKEKTIVGLMFLAVAGILCWFFWSLDKSYDNDVQKAKEKCSYIAKLADGKDATGDRFDCYFVQDGELKHVEL